MRLEGQPGLDTAKPLKCLPRVVHGIQGALGRQGGRVGCRGFQAKKWCANE